MIFPVHSKPLSSASPTSHSGPVGNRTNPNRIKHPEQPAHAPGRTSPATSQHPGLRTRLSAPPPKLSKADKTTTKLAKTAHPNRTISRNTLHFHTSRCRIEKSVKNLPPNSPTSHSSPVGNRTNPNKIEQPKHANRRYAPAQFSRPGRSSRHPGLLQDPSQTDKPSTKLIKTAHPNCAISRKTLRFRSSCAAGRKTYPETNHPQPESEPILANEHRPQTR